MGSGGGENATQQPQCCVFYFVRHAQSTNNALGPESGPDHPGRSSDPVLTDLGEAQAAAVAAHFRAQEDDLAQVPGPRADGYRVSSVFSSAMQRALQTAAPIAQALGAGVRFEVVGDIYEQGGIFDHVEHAGGAAAPPAAAAEAAAEASCSPGHGLSAAQMRERFGPSLEIPKDGEDAAFSASSSGWYVGEGFERMDATTARVDRMAAWLWRLAAQRIRAGTRGAVLIVSHGMLLDMLFKRLLNVPPVRGPPQPSFVLHFNTGVSCVELQPSHDLVQRSDPASTLAAGAVSAAPLAPTAAQLLDGPSPPGVVGMRSLNGWAHLPMPLRTGGTPRGLQACYDGAGNM